MPTGYTSKLHDGDQSFEDYALGVARAFGALITMRDQPHDAPIPDEFGADSYYVKAVEEAEANLAAAKAMTIEEAARRQEGEIYEAEQYRDRYIADREARRQRYEAMLEKARAYVPPSPDHTEFARMLVSQLEESIEFDCGDYTPRVPERVPPEEYHGKQIADAYSGLVRARESLTKAQGRAAERTRWVQQLRESVEGVRA